MLDGIDDIDWAALRHNYGTAENIPGLLKAAARGEPAPSANDSLDNQLLHQGGWVCSAATAALPFLLELIESPTAADREDHVELVAHLAREAAKVDPEYVDDGWPAAWAEAFPQVLRLLDDPGENIRRQAAWSLGNSPRQAPEAIKALRARFRNEPVAVVRTDILDALEDLGDGEWIQALRDDTDPAVAINALLKARTADGTTVDAAELATILDALRETGEWEVYRPILAGETKALTPIDLIAVVAVLAEHTEASHRTSAIRLANVLLAGHRGLDESLIPLLAPLAEAEETRFDAMRLLAAVAAPLPELYARHLNDPTPSGGRGPETVADVALWGLVRVGAPRFLPQLREQVATGARHVRGHDTLPQVWSLPSLGELLELVPDALVPELLPTVRAKIVAGPHPARLDYLHTIETWGPRASAAKPEVKVLLGGDAELMAGRALDAIAPTAPEPPDPAELVDTGLWTRTRAAHRLWRATGETAEAARVLVGVVEAVLDGPEVLPVGRAAIAHLAEMGVREAEAVARRILAEDRRLRYFGGWRVFTEDEAWRRAAATLLRRA